MDPIQISKINDFIFCPLSLYWHSIYEKFDQNLYHKTWQTAGKIRHENIEEERYSTRKNILQGLEVCSEEYGLVGKIDIYDIDSGELIERKNKISRIFDGQKYQLYAQMLCLKEMGYEIKGLSIYSLSDNKKYPIPLPDKKEMNYFLETLRRMREFDPSSVCLKRNENKCANCIYKELCN